MSSVVFLTQQQPAHGHVRCKTYPTKRRRIALWLRVTNPKRIDSQRFDRRVLAVRWAEEGRKAIQKGREGERTLCALPG